MPTISAAVPISPLTLGAGPAISTLNGENAFIPFRYRRLGFLIELVSELSIYVGGRWWPEEQSRQYTTDKDEALGIACDLEYEAAKMLRIWDEPDYWSDPCDFQTALERAFHREAMQHVIAAE
jgi:hypothetical protein